MELAIKGDPKEIAAFLLETGKRHSVEDINEITEELCRSFGEAVKIYGTP